MTIIPLKTFGILQQELVTGKKPLQPEFGEGRDIVCWVDNQRRRNENLIGLVDPHIADESKGKAIDVLNIAIGCTLRLPAQRPPMIQVRGMLARVELHLLIDIPWLRLRVAQELVRSTLATRAYARPAEKLGR